MTDVHTVFLRQPKSLDDKRTDPFWEFGSFGLTGCHRKNLLRKEGTLRDGARLLFIQGGAGELRAVGLTPPIRVVENQGRLHVRWDCGYQPIPFGSAPLIVDNKKNTDFPAVLSFIEGVDRSTPCAKAASKLRTRTKALPDGFSRQVMATFDGKQLPTIERYMDAVAANGSAWHRNAEQHEWGKIKDREAEFVLLLGRFGIAAPQASCRNVRHQRPC